MKWYVGFFFSFYLRTPFVSCWNYQFKWFLYDSKTMRICFSRNFSFHIECRFICRVTVNLDPLSIMEAESKWKNFRMDYVTSGSSRFKALWSISLYDEITRCEAFSCLWADRLFLTRLEAFSPLFVKVLSKIWSSGYFFMSFAPIFITSLRSNYELVTWSRCK